MICGKLSVFWEKEVRCSKLQFFCALKFRLGLIKHHFIQRILSFAKQVFSIFLNCLEFFQWLMALFIDFGILEILNFGIFEIFAEKNINF